MRNQSKSKYKFKGDSEEVEQLKNQLARALADYDNLRKRVEREKEELGKVVSLRLILKLLSVLDMLESAQKHLKDAGLQIAISEFKKVLEEEGLEEIRPKVGEKFDHNVHEAVESVQASGSEKGKKGEIADLVLPGWKFKDLPAQAGGPVARVAKVKVYGEKSDMKKELEEELARGEYM